MDFAQPHWLIIGLLACIGLILLFRLMYTRRQVALEKFAAHQLLGRLTRNVSGNRRRYKSMLLLLAVFMCFAALARPQYGFQWVDIKRKGIDLLFALDTSKSMLAEDIKPNRLKRAHLAILDFVEQLEGDRVGLMPFAGSAYLMCPLTLDYSAFADSLAAVTTDIIPRGGTNIAAVIDTAVKTLNNAANHKILIILTDGENLQGDAVKAAEEAAKQGLTIYTVGVGTSEGELIPLAGPIGQGFVKDDQGNFVTSRLDGTTLSALAEKSNGLYVPLGPAGEGLETIYQQKLALIPKEELAERRQKVPLERFEWPLAAALLFLILELLVGERKKTRTLSFLTTLRRIGRRGKKVTEITLLLLLLGLGITPEASCSRGEEAFNQGDYLQASEYYREKLQEAPSDPQLLYNYGTATYKNNMFDDAIDAFTKALKSDDVELQKKAYYNRGNSYYQKGVEVQQADPATTLNQWKQAVNSLDSALQLDPDDADARHNQNIIQKRLEELEKQQQQQKQQNKENQRDQQDKDKTQEQDQNGETKEQQQNGDPEPDKNPQQAEDGQSKKKQDAGGNDQETRPERPQETENTAGKEDQPAPVDESPEEKNQPTDQANQAEGDGQRQQLGKMTREEAESLLNALKNEEGELNFVPSDPGINGNDIDKDW